MSAVRRVLRTEPGYRVAGVFGALALRALHAGARVRFTGDSPFDPPGSGPVLFVFWHEQLIPLGFAHRHRGAAILASDHADGEYISRILGRLGFLPVRGSSTRGGRKALRGLQRAVEEGRHVAVTPDGPRGPARRFAPEALAIARLAGVPVVPTAAGVDPRWRLERSWDRIIVPRPMARIEIEYGDRVPVPRGLGERGVHALAEELGSTLDALTERVEVRAREPVVATGRVEQ